jgi:hypothetical protein
MSSLRPWYTNCHRGTIKEHLTPSQTRLWKLRFVLGTAVTAKSCTSREADISSKTPTILIPLDTLYTCTYKFNFTSLRKGKVVLGSMNETMNARTGTFSTRCRWVVNFTLCPLSPRKEPSAPARGWVAPKRTKVGTYVAVTAKTKTAPRKQKPGRSAAHVTTHFYLLLRSRACEPLLACPLSVFMTWRTSLLVIYFFSCCTLHELM